MTDPNEIWPSCAYRTLVVQESGNLELTPDFLRHLYGRPELAPIEASCTNERILHRMLLDDPSTVVSDERLQAISDVDARENFHLILAFRDYLGRHPNLESAYFSAVAGETADQVPGPLLDLLVQTILGHLLRTSENAFYYRAGELFFRTQRTNLDQGLLLADAQTLERRRSDVASPLETLIREARGDASTAVGELDVLSPDTADQYAQRSENHDFVLDLTPSRPGMEALCEILARWLEHFHGAKPAVTAVDSVSSESWRWHIGLDRESNTILNALYRSDEVTDEALGRLIALFKMEFSDDGFLQPSIEGRPIFLGLAMERDGTVRLKPQNLIHNLPLATRS